MNKQERTLRSELKSNEQRLLENGFTICDIVWARINENKLLVNSPKDIANFYYQLHSYLKILNSNHDYKRATLVAVMLIKFDSSGLDVYALQDNLIRYHTVKRSVIVTTGIQYLYKHRKYINLDNVYKAIKDSSLIGDEVLPFSYLDDDQLLFVFKDIYRQYSNHNFSIKNLEDYSSEIEFSKKTDLLKSKKWLHEEEITKTWEEIFNDLDEME